MTSTAALKALWRQRRIADRRSMPAAERAVARAVNAEHLWQHLSHTRVICAFLPLPSEPLDPAVLQQLHQGGVQVLLPVVADREALDWVRFPSETVPGPFGIAEPAGPRLGAEAVTSADAVLVPAFAVDEIGIRLGRGGGHYDRTLVQVSAGRAELIAVLFDEERTDRLPAEPHDRRVTAVVTPTGGVQLIGS